MHKQYEQIITKFTGVTVAVLGDFLVDEFVFGEISRVSREAPVLILKYQNRRLCPGGAANTVANVADLGGKVIPVGYIGDDETARALLDLWSDRVERSLVLQIPEVETTRKTRILAGSFHSFQQQVVRIDHENPVVLTPDRETALLDAFTQALDQSDAAIISDYSLGNLTPTIRRRAIELARERRIPLIVDSRDNPSLYPGATTVTPNITEVEAAQKRSIGRGMVELEAACQKALRTWQLEALLVTRGKLGMSLFLGDRSVHIPPYGSEEPVDVTGAGDTVAAVYTTALAAGADFEAAAQLANLAGGMVVMKKGTATISPHELITASRHLTGED